MNVSYLKEDLCNELNISVNELHTMLMSHFDVSYSQLMNILRVEEAKQLLANPELRTRKKIDIAELAGFTSLSQFNVQFKLLTSMTPTEYEIFYHQFKQVTGKNPDNFLMNKFSYLLT